jgi:protein-tyrosine phosphatase
MYTKIYWIHQTDNFGRLGIMARPRGNEWLDGEITNFKKQKVTILVSLLEGDEINELGLSKEGFLCKTHDIDYINFPIADRNIPHSNEKLESMISLLKNALIKGQSIVIHCRMGIGRSSIIAGSVLLEKGIKAKDIIEKISRIRGLKVPDTEKQLNWFVARQ